MGTPAETRLFRNESAMVQRKEDIFKKLETIRDLPTLPVILEKLRKAVHDSKSDAQRIARIIEDDPSMMAKILRVVNSALFAGTERINDLQLAVARMGTSTINNIALSTSVFSAFGAAGEKDFNRTEFWRHSISTGIAVNVLYARYSGNLKKRYTKDVLHLAGLLHDIGKIIFEQYFHEEFISAIRTSSESFIPHFQVELDTIGADHAQAGAWLGKKWHLAEELIEVIRWHHEPENADERHKELVMLCHAGNYVCNLVKIGNSGDAVAPAFFRGVWKRLGVDIEDLSGIMDQIKEESKNSELLLALAAS